MLLYFFKGFINVLNKFLKKIKARAEVKLSQNAWNNVPVHNNDNTIINNICIALPQAFQSALALSEKMCF